MIIFYIICHLILYVTAYDCNSITDNTLNAGDTLGNRTNNWLKNLNKLTVP